ncbi:MAG: DMT family transporter, partial [Deltaproteobacteria bacterium]|nr:DMT family transporter [Deltaproteobacteria bacterium]
MHAMGLGEIAALTTAVSWAGSIHIHTLASRILGGVNVTIARIPLYVTALGLTVLLTGAQTNMPAGALVFMLLSALTGVAVCDPLVYSAAVILGPRIASLVQSLSACLTAILGYLFLGEYINLTGWIGILLASAGVAFVLMEGGLKPGADLSGLSHAQLIKGMVCAFLSALTLALSFLTIKQALLLGMDPVWASFVRMGLGGIMLWCIMLFRGKLFAVLREAWTSWRIMRLLIVGALV